jgi:transglycosylase-like protein with SLT domain
VPGRSPLNRIPPLWFPLALALLLLAPSLPHAAAHGKVRIDLAATPTAPDPSPTPKPTPGSVKLPPAPAVDDGSSGPNVRTRTDRQGSDRIPKAPEPTATAEDTSIPRLDDPVLRWLPEIVAASQQWGVPPELIAAVIRVESQGQPGVISPAGARGLMQMMPDQIGGQGVPQSLWHDPATNIAAGAQGLYTRMMAQGSWEGAVGAYLGFGCDVWGTCTDAYVRAVFGWAAYYQPIIADPRHSGFGILPRDWAFGPIVLYQLPAPPKLEEPPKPKKPTATPTRTVTATPKPGETPTTPEPRNPTPVPTEPGTVPTVAPTQPPQTVPPPTEAPPTEAPTIAPTEPPPPPPTEAPTEGHGPPDKTPNP